LPSDAHNRGARDATVKRLYELARELGVSGYIGDGPLVWGNEWGPPGTRHDPHRWLLSVIVAASVSAQLEDDGRPRPAFVNHAARELFDSPVTEEQILSGRIPQGAPETPRTESEAGLPNRGEGVAAVPKASAAPGDVEGRVAQRPGRAEDPGLILEQDRWRRFIWEPGQIEVTVRPRADEAVPDESY